NISQTLFCYYKTRRHKSSKRDWSSDVFSSDLFFSNTMHAGWKGTVHRIAEKMVRKFESIGVDTKSLLVAIGPCISQEKYEVDEQDRNSVVKGKKREQNDKRIITTINNDIINAH